MIRTHVHKGCFPLNQIFRFGFPGILVANRKYYFWNKVIKEKTSRLLITKSGKN